MLELGWVVAAVAGVVALFLGWQWNQLKQVKAPAAAAPELTGKVDVLRAELQTAKEEIQRKQRLLDEAREEAKKKLRREGKKQEREDEKMNGPDPRDVEIQGLKKGLSSLESQLNQAKKDLEGKTTELDQLRGNTRGEVDAASRAHNDERQKATSLAEENVALKRTLEELRAAKRKEQADRPDVPGTALDLKALPSEAVQELARYFRKGEEFERLYHVAQGQVQLAQDRFLELQRRYFAVCRELALVAGQKPTSDDEAKVLAEGVVAGTETAPRTGGAAGGAPGDAAAAPGDAPRKKRRRRRRRKPGLGGAPGTPGAPGVAADGAAAAGGDEGDEGDEGDDGDEGGDDEGDAPAGDTTAPPPALSPPGGGSAA